jgi:ribosome-associated protein
VNAVTKERKLIARNSSSKTKNGPAARKAQGPDNTAVNITADAPANPAAKPTDKPTAPPDSLALERVNAALDDMKAEEIVQIDLAGKTSLADTMIIANGRSNRHVGSIAERVVEFIKAAGLATPRVEGFPHCDWVLVDAGDVIVHVFRPEVRQFYNLEKMWGADRPTEQAQDGSRPPGAGSAAGNSSARG